jgi:hypothetical protein
VPRDSGDNEAEGVTIVTVIGSTKQGRNVIQGLEDGESGGREAPRQSSGGDCSTDLAQRAVTAVSNRLDCTR